MHSEWPKANARSMSQILFLAARRVMEVIVGIRMAPAASSAAAYVLLVGAGFVDARGLFKRLDVDNMPVVPRHLGPLACAVVTDLRAVSWRPCITGWLPIIQASFQRMRFRQL